MKTQILSLATLVVISFQAHATITGPASDDLTTTQKLLLENAAKKYVVRNAKSEAPHRSESSPLQVLTATTTTACLAPRK